MLKVPRISKAINKIEDQPSFKVLLLKIVIIYLVWIIVIAANFTFAYLGSLTELAYASSNFSDIMIQISYFFSTLDLIIAFEFMKIIEAPLRMALNPGGANGIAHRPSKKVKVIPAVTELSSVECCSSEKESEVQEVKRSDQRGSERQELQSESKPKELKVGLDC